MGRGMLQKWLWVLATSRGHGAGHRSPHHSSREKRLLLAFGSCLCPPLEKPFAAADRSGFHLQPGCVCFSGRARSLLFLPCVNPGSSPADAPPTPASSRSSQPARSPVLAGPRRRDVPGKAEVERGAAPQPFSTQPSPAQRSAAHPLQLPALCPSRAQSHIPPVTFTNSLSLSTPHSLSSQKDSLFHTA